MKIIVLGAGKVGKALTQHLSDEDYDYDVVVIDLHAEKVEAIVNQYDVLGVVGNELLMIFYWRLALMIQTSLLQ